MRAVIQRVSSASVTIDAVVTAQIARGLLVLLGVQTGDIEADAVWLAEKTAALRIFPDADGKMNLSLRDLLASSIAAVPQPSSSISHIPTSASVAGALVVSQFTLLASTRKGTRPSFNDAAKPDAAIPLYEFFVRQLETALGAPVATGRFGAMMQVALVNDGPVTLVLDSRLRE